METKAQLCERLLRLTDVVVKAREMSRPAISKAIFNDNTFFTRIKRGDNWTIDSYEKVLVWLSANWPEDTAWPPEVTRPVNLLQKAS